MHGKNTDYLPDNWKDVQYIDTTVESCRRKLEPYQITQVFARGSGTG